MKTNLQKSALIEAEKGGEKPVEVYFDLESSGWNEIYQKQDVYSVIHQDRRVTALAFFDELSLPRDARILEIGCGAGLTTVDIATRGYHVTAVDSSKAMVELARQNTAKFQMDERVSIDVMDIYHLDYPEHSFDLIIALGVIPWLPDMPRAMAAISRLAGPGGYVLMNIDNRYRLNHLLDPVHNPFLMKFKDSMKSWAEKSGLKQPSQTPPVKMYSVPEFKNCLHKVGLEIVRYRMLGFGPFQFFRANLFTDQAGVRVYRYLQSLADRGHPLLRRSGAQYLVLAVNQPREER